MKIIPAVLATSFEELAYYLNRAHSLSGYIHIDVADGELVNNKTVGPEPLKELDPDVEMEVHLMVKNPLAWIKYYQLPRVRKIIFHYEAFDDLTEVINEIRHSGLEPILAVNPETSVDQIEPYLEKVEGVQIMTIHPGYQGLKFMPETLVKTDQLKKKYPDIPVAVDGGVNLDTIKLIIEHDIDQAVVGSAIVKADNARHAYETLVEIAS